jgi:hypothetical protein
MRLVEDEWVYYQEHGNFPSFQWKIKNRMKKIFSKFFIGISTRGDS